MLRLLSFLPLLSKYAVVAAVIGAAVFLYTKGRLDANHANEMRQVQAELNLAKAVLEAQRKIAADDKAQAEKDAATIAQYEVQVESLLDQVDHPDAECLTDADTKRLLDAFETFGSKPPPFASK
jgi:uncharacterized protein HemX